MPKVVRTIKDGKVTIGGKVYAPKKRENELPYTGKLDGTRYVFHRYADPNAPDGFAPFVYMSQPEKWSDGYTDADGVPWPPHCFNGFVHWEFWETTD